MTGTAFQCQCPNLEAVQGLPGLVHLLGATQHRPRPVGEQRSHVDISAFADAAQAPGVAAGAFFGRQADS